MGVLKDLVHKDDRNKVHQNYLFEKLKWQLSFMKVDDIGIGL